MPRETGAGLAEDRRDRDVLFHHRHVARLAASRLLVVAVQPFLVRHLLRQLADHLALCVERLGEERVARRAQFRRANVLGFHRLKRRRRLHDRGVSLVDLERTKDVTRAGRGFLVDLEPPDETFPLAQILVGDLMTDRAGHAIVRQPIVALAQVRRQVGERFPFAAGQPGFVPHHRHVADGAFVLDERGSGGVIAELAPHTGHPVRIAAGVGHHAGPPVGADRDVLAGRRRDAVVAGKTAIRGLKMRAVVFVGGNVARRHLSGRSGLLRLHARNLDRGDREHQREKGTQGSEHPDSPYQPWSRPPSTQSHST